MLKLPSQTRSPVKLYSTHSDETAWASLFSFSFVKTQFSDLCKFYKNTAKMHKMAFLSLL